jgi:hypothetical protein
VTSHVVLVVVLSFGPGQFAACGPCPPLFTHVVVVVEVVSVKSPFTGSSVVVVVDVVFGASNLILQDK